MTREQQLDFLIKKLSPEIIIPSALNDKWHLFRSLVNVREPKPVSHEFLSVQNELLQTLITEKRVTDISDLKPIKDNIFLWQGDITTLSVDAIVNAANSGMLGCFCPCHACIDNAIHTFAGIQLRMECAEIMRLQGVPEPTGKAKITSAYNLPSKYIIHTVGPIVDSPLSESHCKLLHDCYESCLILAKENKVKSIAFCCISTGEFHFPNQKAAEIAIATVTDFFKEQNEIKVIFNVFKDTDWRLYHDLLK